MTVVPERTTRGRPRSEAADRAIAEAALEVLSDEGFAGFSVEAVAQRAGVGKATIYRRFDGRDDLLVAALDRFRDDLPVVPERGSARERLEALLDIVRTPMGDSRGGRVMAQVISAGPRHPELLQVFYERVFGPRRASISQALRDGIDEGWVREDLDVDAAYTVLVGAMIFLKVWASAAPGQASTSSIVDMALAGMGPR